MRPDVPAPRPHRGPWGGDPGAGESTFWLSCLDEHCGNAVEYNEGDEPERCSCGAPYDEDLFHHESAAAAERARDEADALAEDAFDADRQDRREREITRHRRLTAVRGSWEDRP